MFIGLISFGSALLIALTILLLSQCIHSSHIESPQNTPVNTAPLVATNKNTGGTQTQAAPNQQNSAGIFGLGAVFEDAGKSINSMMGAKTGACGNDPEILGKWTEQGSKNPIKISFTECEESVSRLRSCSGTYSYTTSGGVLTGKLLAAEPSYCGQVGSTDSAQYQINGDTLTIQGGAGGAHTYRRGS
ncbi:MAG: hypothetical protein PHP70_03585 [Gallionella sp.]|nr:hypothetical protein [Gallionella sp.]